MAMANTASEKKTTRSTSRPVSYVGIVVTLASETAAGPGGAGPGWRGQQARSRF